VLAGALGAFVVWHVRPRCGTVFWTSCSSCLGGKLVQFCRMKLNVWCLSSAFGEIFRGAFAGAV